MPDFLQIAGLITALAAILVPTGAFLAVHIQEKNKRKLAKDKNETEEEKAELSAQDAALQILTDRIDKADQLAREARTEFKAEVDILKGEVETLSKKLRDFDAMWIYVMSTVQQLFWQVYMQWPTGAPGPKIDPKLIHRLDNSRVGHVLPEGWRNQTEPKEEE